MTAVVLTTLPHFLTLFVSPTPFYSLVVFSSSSLSVVWHISNEDAFSTLGIFDHLFAAIWFVTDCYYFSLIHRLSLMYGANGSIFLLNLIVTHLAQRNIVPYFVGHSIWHLLSSVKSIFLAFIIKTSYQQTELDGTQ